MRWRLILAAAIASVLVSCGSLPRTLRDDIAAEHDRLLQAERQLKRTVAMQNPGLPDWSSRLQAAQQELDRAKADGVQLDKAANGPGNNDARRHAQQLLAEERELRLGALRDADALEAEANKWADIRNNAPKYIARMQGEYDAIHQADLSKVAAAVDRGGQDWPGKKSDLDARFAALKASAADADSQWSSSEAARKAAAAGPLDSGAIATLLQTDDALAKEADGLTKGADQLTGLTGQLYYSWDKILEDLDQNRDGFDTVYREKIKTVKTHFTDVAAKKTDVSSDVEWEDVPASQYRAVESDLGMAISHKDAGLYDSEATNVAQPPGFAYMATPEQGRNQYGYWDHGVWTWLPEYLIMRELFWGPRYAPVYINEFNGYYTARNLGRSYYGAPTPAAPPKYGSHGTFTEQRYAGSRYVQSGGFGGSKYSSGPQTAARPGPSAGGFAREFGEHEGGSPSVGKRFGGAPSGKRFGGGGSAPRMAPRRFGRR
jgi:hypothetical protein